MEEHGIQEKDGLGVRRLSESRPIFKPVLVKDLLAEQMESDDDSDDQENQAVNSDNSEEELEDLQSLQALPEENTLELERVKNSNLNENVHPTSNMDLTKPIQSNTNLKDENYQAAEKCRSVSKRTSVEPHGPNVEMYGPLKSTSVLDKRRSIPSIGLNDSTAIRTSYVMETNCQSQNTVKKQEAEEKEMEQKRYSTKLNKTPVENENVTSQTVTAQTLETPLKQQQLSNRPNPCNSHRNIFQTPQSKDVNEILKNSLQTPATIFSHWSQQHMAQTPMQNQLPISRESVPTPIINSSMPHSSHENSRISCADKKSVRRPLAETMSSSQSYNSQLQRLQEASNESHPIPPISRYSSNQTVIKVDHQMEKKPVNLPGLAAYESKENDAVIKHENQAEKRRTNVSAFPVQESKENYIPNDYEKAKVKIEQHQNSPLVSEPKNSMGSNHDLKANVAIAQYSVQPQKIKEEFKQKENLSLNASPVEPILNSHPISQKNGQNSGQYKMITVNEFQYMILGTLGQGMSCEVYRAQDLHSSELRAIKCVNMSKFDKDAAQGCLQEICMLDKLRDPCIVHMYSFQLKQPMLYVVMEMGDTDLSRLIKSMLQEKKKIPLTMILYYWTEMLTAVKHIHDNGVIHSDLKPANFLLVRGRLKLIDFGIAANINADMTSVVRNNSIGTLNYISPEALVDTNAGSNNSPDHNNRYKISYKSDVWSLGCILYQLVYNAAPFSHIRQQFAKMQAIVDPKAKIKFPLSNGSEEIPRILLDVMKRCLQRDMKARPTVADLLKIPYLQSNISQPAPVPNIPHNMLVKIRNSLTDDEWRHFTEILDRKN